MNVPNRFPSVVVLAMIGLVSIIVASCSTATEPAEAPPGQLVTLYVQVHENCFGPQKDTLVLQAGGVVYIVRPSTARQRLRVPSGEVFSLKLYRHFIDQNPPIWERVQFSVRRDSTVHASCE